TSKQLSNLHIVNDHIFHHKVLRINYTTYDVHRDQDSINPQTHSDVIVLANESETDSTHPYWYARIIGIFHVDICYNNPEGDFKNQKVFQIDFAWVCWFGFDASHHSGFTAKWPHYVGIVDGTDPGAFGFLNLDDIIQAVHLIPVYKLGQIPEFLPPSIACWPEDKDQDYKWYSVDM
ncbi:hypothetical protein ARMGADRAFT_931262, partial [Armillaria gallica]